MSIVPLLERLDAAGLHVLSHALYYAPPRINQGPIHATAMITPTAITIVPMALFFNKTR